MQQVKNTEKDDVEPLQYILARLNRIEDAIMSNKRNVDSRVEKEIGGIRIFTTKCKYMKATKEIDEIELEESLISLSQWRIKR